jgi:hypothetical protein
VEASPSKTNKKNGISGSRRLAPVNLDKIQLQFLVVLKREANRLLDLSHAEKLSDECSKTLVNYLKLLKDIRKSEAEDLESMTDEELEAMAAKNTKKENPHADRIQSTD